MKKIEFLTEKMFTQGHLFYGVWEKYISTLKSGLSSDLIVSAEDRSKVMEYISEAYKKIGNNAEAILWKAKANAESGIVTE